MKTKIVTTIVLITCIMLLSSTVLFSQSKKGKNLQTLELQISGMTCEEGCAKGIESSVYKIKGVKKSVVNFDTQTATITFDADKISKEDIIKNIEAFNPGEGVERKYNVTEINNTTNGK